MPLMGSNLGNLLGGGLPLPLPGLLVVMVTPILPDSLLNASALRLGSIDSFLGINGMSMLLFELSESANCGGMGDSCSSNELAKVSSSCVTLECKRGVEVEPVVDSS